MVVEYLFLNYSYFVREVWIYVVQGHNKFYDIVFSYNTYHEQHLK